MSAKERLLSQFLNAFQFIAYFGRGYSDVLTNSVAAENDRPARFYVGSRSFHDVGAAPAARKAGANSWPLKAR